MFMKRYLLYIFLFFACAAALDRAIGAGCDYLNTHLQGGDNKSHYDIYNIAKADILILGSSRATHHYVPQIFEDSLEMTCYNCGYDALGILCMYTRYQMMLHRHTPRLVIYDILPDNDIYGDAADHLKYIGDMKRFADLPIVARTITAISPVEKYKLCSQLYRYNTSIFQILGDYIHKPQPIDRGYRPLQGTMDWTPAPYHSFYDNASPDTMKIAFLHRLIISARRHNIRLVFAASPWYGADTSNDYCEIIRLCREEHVPFLNFYTDRRFVRHKAYFKDSAHLNEKGARKYTRAFLQALTDSGYIGRITR